MIAPAEGFEQRFDEKRMLEGIWCRFYDGELTRVNISPMTPAFLFTVEEAFQISGRGCVLAPRGGEEPEVQTVRVGDLVRLVKPDGEVTDTRIAGIEMLNYGGRKPIEKGFSPILLPASLTKDDVPSGNRVYYLGSSKR